MHACMHARMHAALMHACMHACRYEMWEASEAARAGLAAAATVCIDADPARIFARSSQLARRLRTGLATIPGLVLRDAPPSFVDKAGAEAAGVEGAGVEGAGMDAAPAAAPTSKKRKAGSANDGDEGACDGAYDGAYDGDVRGVGEVEGGGDARRCAIVTFEAESELGLESATIRMLS